MSVIVEAATECDIELDRAFKFMARISSKMDALKAAAEAPTQVAQPKAKM